MFETDSEWALITGATSGMGYEMARMLAAKGHNLVIVGHNEEKLCNLARELNEVSDVIAMTIDLSLPGSSNELFEECRRLGLKINMLINNTRFNIS